MGYLYAAAMVTYFLPTGDQSKCDKTINSNVQNANSRVQKVCHNKLPVPQHITSVAKFQPIIDLLQRLNKVMAKIN